MSTSARELGIDVSDRRISALATMPRDPIALYVLAHGAGAGMRHPFMETITARLADRRIATLRYQFPYMEAGKKRPDHRNLLVATVGAAVDCARDIAEGLPLFAGGKSMGGRMTSQAQTDAAMDDVRGLIFLGFPLHGMKKPDVARAAHLADIDIPMLFVQGTRDRLADLGAMRSVVRDLGSAATMHIVEGGDHSFAVLKRSGRTAEEVMNEIGDAVAGWVGEQVSS